MNEFMNFITQLNNVKTKSDPEFIWLTDFSHYDFLLKDKLYKKSSKK